MADSVEMERTEPCESQLTTEREDLELDKVASKLNLVQPEWGGDQ